MTARQTKWVNSAKLVRPLVEVARRSLVERLDEFSKRLKKAAKKPAARDVHRVRVAARRLLAALEFFADLLPSKESKRLKKQVRRAHRAAGEMRNLDVFTGPRRASLPIRMQAALAAQRQRAHRVLVDIYKQLKKKTLRKRGKLLLRRVRWRGANEPPPFAEEGLRRLRGIASEFATLARSNSPSAESLHTLRIAGKRLRYTVEFCEDLIRPIHLRKVLAQLERFQDVVGAISDRAMAIEFSERCAPSSAPTPRRGRPPVTTGLARERKALATAVRGYRKQFPRIWFAELAAMFAK